MKSEITGKTKLIGLIGSPVCHSRSPSMQNGVFEALNLDYAYCAFEVGLDEASAAVSAIRTLKLRGCNVTTPLKSAVCEYLDALTPVAEMAGAVNVIVNDNGYLTGHITDGEGYMMSLEREGVEYKGEKMTLLGAGGAATAVAIQAADSGIGAISMFNHKDHFYANGEKMIERLRRRFSCDVKMFDLADLQALKAEIASSDILTNGTTVGMEASKDLSLIPSVDYFHPGLVVSDLIYVPAETTLLKMARSVGNKVVGGLGMQLYQGVSAFKLWTGQDMPVDVARKILFK